MYAILYHVRNIHIFCLSQSVGLCKTEQVYEQYVQVKLNSYKSFKIKSGCFSKAKQYFNDPDDSKGVNNRHMWFDSVTNSGKDYNE